MNIGILAGVIFLIALLMTMTGRGGGNFYVLALVLSGLGMHEAATSGQFVLICSSFASMLFFKKKKMIDWRLVLLIGCLTVVSAYLGGFLSDRFDAQLLKIVFSVFIIIASVLMFKPLRTKVRNRKHFHVELKSNETIYQINLLVFIPVVLISGFVAGMVGISGGSFLVPLMVITVGVPMHTAVGSSTALVWITASAGFLGHVSSGHFDVKTSLVLAFSAILGSLIGTRMTLQANPRTLKIIFATTSVLAALIMLYNVCH